MGLNGTSLDHWQVYKHMDMADLRSKVAAAKSEGDCSLDLVFRLLTLGLKVLVSSWLPRMVYSGSLYC